MSGAWEGAGDTLFHVSGMGHGRTRLHIQKARWASTWHAKTLELRWTDGEASTSTTSPSSPTTTSPTRSRRHRRHPDRLAPVDKADTGGRADRKRTIRDRLLADGVS